MWLYVGCCKNREIKGICKKIINEWPIVFDHIDEKAFSKNSNIYGFCVENLFNETALNFSKIMKVIKG